MISENYTFACPVCAVRLSVPKALAGVRGPCPQCHHEITAPEPSERRAAVLAGAGMEAEGAGTVGGGPMVPPPLPTAPRPDAPPLPEMERRSPELDDHDDGAESTPAGEEEPPEMPDQEQAVAATLPTPPAEDESFHWDNPPAEERDAPIAADRGPARSAERPQRRSRLAWVAGSLLLIGLAAAAALHFLPPTSLRGWVAKVWPGAATGSGAKDVSDAAAPPTAGEPPAGVDPSSGGPVEVREALSPPDQSGTVAPAVTPSPEPDGPALAAPLADPPAGVASTPPTTAPTAPPDAPPSPATAAQAMASDSAAPAAPSGPTAPGESGPASLLPDISAAEAGEAPAVSEARAGAEEALTLFLQARTWTDRLALSEGGESLRSEMEAYYRKGKDGPNPPTSVEHVASAPLPDGQRTVEVFHVTFSDLPQGFPVPVLQTENGWKIDWQAFTEFRESRLKKFLAEYQDAPSVFRVRLQRAHYQDRAVPNIDRKYIFRIAAPIDGHEGYVFVDKSDSIVGPKIEDKLEWDTIHHVMAKLKWVRGANGKGFVELRDIVSHSWRPEP